MRKRDRHGQSLIEYSLIVLLVILGIVVMGPYVLRSINAHFKMWDEEIQDSHNERLNVLPTVTGTPGGDTPPGGGTPPPGGGEPPDRLE